MAQAGTDFVVKSLGGIAIRWAAGLLVAWVRPRIHDRGVETVVSLLTPFIAYLPAEWLHLSSVLAVVTAGVYVSRRMPQISTPRMRLRAYAVWETLVFLLNGLVFILIGLQLPVVVRVLSAEVAVGRLIGYAAAISLVCVVVQLLWVFPATYLPVCSSGGSAAATRCAGRAGVRRRLDGDARHRLARRGGMLPLAMPERDLIIFITFGVILVTLVGQGLTLAPLIRRLRLTIDRDEEVEEVTARHLGALAAVERLDQLAAADGETAPMLGRLRATYDERIAFYSSRLIDAAAAAGDDYAPGGNGVASPVTVARLSNEQVLREALAADRRLLLELRDVGVIGDEVMRRVQEVLDLEESKLGA